MQGFMRKGKLFILILPYRFHAEKWAKALNTLFPEDITVLNVKNADQFHARFHAIGKGISLYDSYVSK